MFSTFVLAAVGAGLTSLLPSLLAMGRIKKDIDESGQPVMRYAATPYLMLLGGLVFTAFGVYEWFDPRNHHYSDNLTILSYAPIALGVLCFLAAIYFRGYRAVLTPSAIRVSRWPFGTTEYPLAQLVSLDEKGQQVFLHFRDGRKLAVTYMLSGSKHFIGCIEERRQM